MIENFENEYYKAGKLIIENECSKLKGTNNQMSEYDWEQYDKLIDSFSYDDDDSIANKDDDIIAPSSAASGSKQYKKKDKAKKQN